MALISRSVYTGKILHWFTLFMAAPIFIIIFNITLYIFPILLYRFKKAFGYYFKFRPLVHIPTIAFMLGAIISAINSVNVENSMQVLPNYIYWGFLIIFISSHSNNIDYKLIAKSSFWGIVVLSIYYYAQNLLPNISLFSPASPNGYSFSVICFAPLSIVYLLNKNQKNYALVLLTVLSLIQLFEGRRAGFVLVLIGGLLTIYGQRVKFIQLLFIVLIGGAAIMGLLSIKPIENIILNSNERIYGLIYKTDEIRKTDASYLTRVAMVRKGLSIYRDFPLTGIGLNNFTSYNADISSDFEGADLVLREKNINQMSAHNSYISLLGEGGLLLLIPFLVLLVIGIGYLVIYYNSISSDIIPIFIGFIGMLVHLYFISALLNVFAWYLIGLTLASVYIKKNKYIKR